MPGTIAIPIDDALRHSSAAPMKPSTPSAKLVGTGLAGTGAWWHGLRTAAMNTAGVRVVSIGGGTSGWIESGRAVEGGSKWLHTLHEHQCSPSK